jgi:ribonuclease Z
MNFRVLILGSNSAIPAFGRFPSAQIVQHYGDAFLIDCGEGTQFRLSQFKVKRSKIRTIFISHLHGDHVFGLPGLLTSLSLSGHEHPMEIIGPPGLQSYLNIVFEISQSNIRFPLKIHEIEGNGGVVLETNKLIVTAFPLVHRIPTYGYLFREKTKKNRIDQDKLDQFKLNPQEIHSILKGIDVTGSDGSHLTASDFILPPNPSYTYAYCSDTMYDEQVAHAVKGVDLLYHEATFDNSMSALAHDRYHTTSGEAGKIATMAGVRKLLIGHFSSRYMDLQILLDETRAEFPNTELAKEGQWFEVDNI